MPSQKIGSGKPKDLFLDMPIHPLGLACNISLGSFVFPRSQRLDNLPPQKETCPKSISSVSESPHKNQLIKANVAFFSKYRYVALAASSYFHFVFQRQLRNELYQDAKNSVTLIFSFSEARVAVLFKEHV